MTNDQFAKLVKAELTRFASQLVAKYCDMHADYATRPDVTQDEANRLVWFASQLLATACGRHTYCYDELCDMFPRGHDPASSAPNATCHGADDAGEGLTHNADQWTDYYTN